MTGIPFDCWISPRRFGGLCKPYIWEEVLMSPPQKDSQPLERLITHHAMHTLRRLRLYAFPLDWSSVALPNLAHLTVHGLVFATDQSIAIEL